MWGVQKLKSNVWFSKYTVKFYPTKHVLKTHGPFNLEGNKLSGKDMMKLIFVTHKEICG